MANECRPYRWSAFTYYYGNNNATAFEIPNLRAVKFRNYTTVAITLRMGGNELVIPAANPAGGVPYREEVFDNQSGCSVDKTRYEWQFANGATSADYIKIIYSVYTDEPKPY